MLPPAEPRHPAARGDELELTIDAMGAGPDGVGHLGDYVVFVPGTLPGERVWTRITSATRKFARGELLELLAEAPERRSPGCQHYLRCGGCQRRHQDYGAQLLDKQARLQRAVDHAAGPGRLAVLPTVPARPPHGQRHKVVVHLRNTRQDGLEPCFHRLRSPELEAITECPASDPLAWDLALETVRLLHELPHGAWDPDFAPDALLRSVLVRATTHGACHLVLVARQPEIPGLLDLVPALQAAGATAIAVNHNPGEFSQLLGPHTERIAGPQRLAETLGDTTYLISPTAFFQTSPQQALVLVERVLEWLRPGPADVVADLFCGGGLLTLPLARRAKLAFGVEWNALAVGDARAAAEHNGLRNVTFHSGDVPTWLLRCGRDLPRPNLVALDPPRAGLDPAVVRELARLRPQRLAYVSCEPETLGRDLRLLLEAGYRLHSALPIDMFPETAHLEALACLERTG